YHIRDMIEELSNSLNNELDYYKEARNGERIAQQFSDNPDIYIPSIHWNYTTKKVLTADMVKGVKVNQVEFLQENNYDCHLLADRIANAMFEQVLDYGFFHGD